MGLKVEVKADATTRSGEARATGKPYTMHEQEAWIYRKQPNGEMSPYPERIRFQLDKPEDQYAHGVYSLDVEASIYIGDFNSLRLSRRPVMKLVQAAKLATAA